MPIGIQKREQKPNKVKQGRPYKYSLSNGELDIERIEGLVNAYIESATEKNMFSIAGLALALGIDVETLLLWSKGLTSQPRPDETPENIAGRVNNELASVIKKAKTYILQWLCESASAQRTAMNIFLLKNWYGYSDKEDGDKTAIQINIDMGEFKRLAK